MTDPFSFLPPPPRDVGLPRARVHPSKMLVMGWSFCCCPLPPGELWIK